MRLCALWPDVVKDKEVFPYLQGLLQCLEDPRLLWEAEVLQDLPLQPADGRIVDLMAHLAKISTERLTWIHA